MKGKKGMGWAIAGAVILYLIGAVWLTLGVLCVLPATKEIFGDSHLVPMAFELGGGAVVLATVVLIVGIVRAKKMKKEAATANVEPASAPEVQSGPVEKVASKSDLPDGTVRETHGMDLRTIFSHAADVNTIEVQDGTHVATFDFLWGNIYDGESYLVVSLGRGEDFRMYILHVNNDAPDTAEYVEEGPMRERVITDCTAALQAAGVVFPPTGGRSEGGKFDVLRGLKAKIKPRPKAEKSKRLAWFSVVLALYLCLLGYGLFEYFHPMGNVEVRLLVQAIALAYLLITPSLLLFFAVYDPFELKKGVLTAFTVIGIVLMVAADAFGIYMLLNMPVPENQVMSLIMTAFLPAALVVSTVAYIFAYLFWCKGLPDGWQIGTAILVTLLFPVATALILLFIVICLVIALVRFLLSALGILVGDTDLGRGFRQGWTGEGGSSGQYDITVDGYTRHLSHLSGNRYKDNVGDIWVTDDGGHTFHKE